MAVIAALCLTGCGASGSTDTSPTFPLASVCASHARDLREIDTGLSELDSFASTADLRRRGPEAAAVRAAATRLKRAASVAVGPTSAETARAFVAGLVDLRDAFTFRTAVGQPTVRAEVAKFKLLGSEEGCQL